MKKTFPALLAVAVAASFAPLPAGGQDFVIPDVGPGRCVASCGGASLSGGGGGSSFNLPSGFSGNSGLGREFGSGDGIEGFAERSSASSDGEAEAELRELLASVGEGSATAPALALSGDTPALLGDATPRGIALAEGATPEPPMGVSLASFDPQTEARIGEVFTDRQLEIWRGRGHQYRAWQYSRAAQLFFDAQTLTFLAPLLVTGGTYMFFGAPAVVTPTLMQAMSLAALKFGSVVIQGEAAADAARAKTGSERDTQLAGAAKIALEGGTELVDSIPLSAAKTMIELAIRESGRPQEQSNSLGRVFGTQ